MPAFIWTLGKFGQGCGFLCPGTPMKGWVRLLKCTVFIFKTLNWCCVVQKGCEMALANIILYCIFLCVGPRHCFQFGPLQSFSEIHAPPCYGPLVKICGRTSGDRLECWWIRIRAGWPGAIVVFGNFRVFLKTSSYAVHSCPKSPWVKDFFPALKTKVRI